MSRPFRFLAIALVVLFAPGAFAADDAAVRAAIELYWQGMLDHGVAAADFVIGDVHSSGDMAVERGHVDLKFSDPAAPPATVRYLVMWQRQADGAWKIRYDIWNDAPKPPAAAQPEAAAPAAGR